MNYYEECAAAMDGVEIKFTGAGATTIPVTDFRSAVIEALQAEIQALRADLKLTQQKLRAQETLVAGYNIVFADKLKPELTMGEKLANALKHDSYWTGV